MKTGKLQSSAMTSGLGESRDRRHVMPTETSDRPLEGTVAAGDRRLERNR